MTTYDAVAEQQVRDMLPQTAFPEPIGEIGRTLGQYPPPAISPRAGGSLDVEDWVRATYHQIWSQRLFNIIAERYATSHLCVTSSNRRLHGQAELTTFLISLLGMFPDAGMVVDHVCWNGDQAQDYRVAVRWTLTGVTLRCLINTYSLVRSA